MRLAGTDHAPFARDSLFQRDLHRHVARITDFDVVAGLGRTFAEGRVFRLLALHRHVERLTELQAHHFTLGRMVDAVFADELRPTLAISGIDTDDAGR